MQRQGEINGLSNTYLKYYSTFTLHNDKEGIVAAEKKAADLPRFMWGRTVRMAPLGLPRKQ